MRVTENMILAACKVLRDRGPCSPEATPIEDTVRKMLEAAEEAWIQDITDKSLAAVV